jgi:hypothetical protein
MNLSPEITVAANAAIERIVAELASPQREQEPQVQASRV